MSGFTHQSVGTGGGTTTVSSSELPTSQPGQPGFWRSNGQPMWFDGNTSEPVDIDAQDEYINPDPSIGLAADSVGEAVTELATDIHSLNNITSVALSYQMQRNT